mmetsp:Transcript_60034/g.170098  ORF Transcript_60034/g.170098 Transcript_60034/m.170098 type:complete len:205 (+) Transcript_60034:922-1536(+)
MLRKSPSFLLSEPKKLCSPCRCSVMPRSKCPLRCNDSASFWSARNSWSVRKSSSRQNLKSVNEAEATSNASLPNHHRCDTTAVRRPAEHLRKLASGTKTARSKRSASAASGGQEVKRYFNSKSKTLGFSSQPLMKMPSDNTADSAPSRTTSSDSISGYGNSASATDGSSCNSMHCRKAPNSWQTSLANTLLLSPSASQINKMRS